MPAAFVTNREVPSFRDKLYCKCTPAHGGDLSPNDSPQRKSPRKAQLVADFRLERLHAWGVRRIYGYPGDGINAILGALDRAKEDLDFIQARHEEMAAFMACGHAKYTGPSAERPLRRELDHQPVVAIVGQQGRAALGGNYQQEVDLVTLFQGRRRRVRPHGDRRRADPSSRRPGGSDRAPRADGRKPPPPEISSEQFYEIDLSGGFARGFSIQIVGPLPIGWAEHVLADGHWGRALREYMRDYNHWSVLGTLNELLPQAENRVTLADDVDERGIPVARFDYSQCDNDRARLPDGHEARGERRRCGPSCLGRAEPVCHRRQRDADAGSANPALTIMALASRLADRLGSKRVAR